MQYCPFSPFSVLFRSSSSQFNQLLNRNFVKSLAKNRRMKGEIQLERLTSEGVEPSGRCCSATAYWSSGTGATGSGAGWVAALAGCELTALVPLVDGCRAEGRRMLGRQGSWGRRPAGTRRFSSPVQSCWSLAFSLVLRIKEGTIIQGTNSATSWKPH